ncbi:hypothetical protein POJ06DRAFT_68293 [Lipomyces tetrasporus]|uniref:Transmembrane protein n=1 Tax=Lipomyces tetrasporus TaxID=54092 RepID=A0AAD7QUH9_9ASCO|nr:uncharacterized protein POJ06DRAFT_68293 [Lipomyces tetrasporus]KAJ8101639.1 hypothetical protein POJ06DRAFT_68293 [Lipomyces tetrasporus]
MLAIIVAGTIFLASGCIAHCVPCTGSCRRHLKSSEVSVKGPYTAQCLLSDALSSKYQVSINSDSLLSSFSYQNSPYFASLLTGTRTPGQKKKVLFDAAWSIAWCLMVGLPAPAVISGYAEGDISFLISTVLSVIMLILITISLFIGIVTLKSSFKEEDVACATVYLNTTEENWMASSELALFNPADRIQIAIKWSKEVLLYGPCICALFLSGLSQVIFNEGDGHHKVTLSLMSSIISTIVLALANCFGVVLLVLLVRMIRRSVPTVEVQLAQAVSKEEADNLDMLEFDIGKVVRKFANDIAKDFASNGNKWTPSAGGYYDFAIAGVDGGLVYGRMKARRISANA